MGQYRIQRLNDQLRDEISKLILRGDVKDPRVNTFLSINRVEVTQDLSYGKVFVSSFLTDGDVKLGVDGLNAAAGFIQREISKPRSRLNPWRTGSLRLSLRRQLKTKANQSARLFRSIYVLGSFLRGRLILSSRLLGSRSLTRC